MLNNLVRGVLRTPRTRRRRWRSVLPFLALWVCAASVLAVRAESRRPVPPAEGDAFSRLFDQTDSTGHTGSDSTATDSRKAMRAVIVAQRHDCDGNLGVASILTRPPIARAVTERAVLIEGSASDTTQLRSRLPRSLQHAAIRLLQRNEREALAALGHHATPILLLFDERNRLRLSAPVSSDPVEVVATRRAIMHLVSNDPLK